MMMRKGGNRNAPIRKPGQGHGNASGRMVAQLDRAIRGATAVPAMGSSTIPAEKPISGPVGSMGTPTPRQMPLSEYLSQPTMSGPMGGMGTPPVGGPNMGGMMGPSGGMPAGNPGFPSPTGMKKGGKVKAKSSYKSGGSVKASSASKRGDGCAIKGKTKGRMV